MTRIFDSLSTTLGGAIGRVFTPGTTYYVDNAGNDANSGKTPSAAWQTLAQVNGATFNKGDRILLKAGGTWREQLTVPSSNLIVDAYGVGAAPIISGADLVTAWTLEAQAGTENFTDGTGAKPISWWYFAESSGTRADSNTTSVNDLTAINAPTHGTGPGGIANCVTFVAASSQRLTRTSANLSSNFPAKQATADVSVTAGCWVMPTASNANVGIMGVHLGWQLITESSVIKARIWDDGTTFHDAVAPGAYTANTWVHAVIRWNQGNGAIDLFLNGVKQAGSGTSATLYEGSADDFNVGYEAFQGYLDGSVAEAFVFNTNLTDQQIADIYNGGLGGVAAINLYYKALGSQPKQLFQDGARLGTAAAKASVGTGQMWWDSGNTRVYVRCTDDAAPSTHTMENSTRTNTVQIAGRTSVAVRNLALTKAVGDTVRISGTSATVAINTCDIGYGWLDGINAQDATLALTNCTIASNAVHHNMESGIHVARTNTGTLISNNTVHHNCLGTSTPFTGGIYTYGDATGPQSGLVIIGNAVYQNGVSNATERGVGIQFDGNGPDGAHTSNAMIVNNVSWGNTKQGILAELCSGCTIAHNLVYSNEDNIVVQRAISNNTIANNTSWGASSYGMMIGQLGDVHTSGVVNNVIRNNVVFGTQFGNCNFVARDGAENDGTNGSGNVYDHNCFGVAFTNFIMWGAGVFKSTYTAWETAKGSTSSSVQADPLVVSTVTPDFSLQAGSPCIDAGVVIAGITDGYLGAAPDLGYKEKA